VTTLHFKHHFSKLQMQGARRGDRTTANSSWSAFASDDNLPDDRALPPAPAPKWYDLTACFSPRPGSDSDEQRRWAVVGIGFLIVGISILSFFTQHKSAATPAIGTSFVVLGCLLIVRSWWISKWAHYFIARVLCGPSNPTVLPTVHAQRIVRPPPPSVAFEIPPVPALAVQSPRAPPKFVISNAPALPAPTPTPAPTPAPAPAHSSAHASHVAWSSAESNSELENVRIDDIQPLILLKPTDDD
jgi:hypothetical protein